MINPTTEGLMQGLDDLCFEKVLERDGHECIICKLNGKTAKSKLQPHHAWSRSFKYIRWNLWNIYPLCENHHIFGVHSNKALTEAIFRALIAVMYPDRYKFITKERSVFFDVNVPNLIKKKREIMAIKFKGGME